MLENADFTGRVVSGYRVEELLGKGGMGVVYRALDLQLGRRVALKFVAPDATSGGASRGRLLREAQAAAGLNHPNICTIYAVGEFEGQLFIAMEYLEGADVASIVRQGALPWEQAVSICRHVGLALAEAHDKHIFHKDVKCANIFLTRQGVSKLLDFGIAICTAEPDVTQTLGLTGTLCYMAPEQIEHGIASARSDIWALGVALYEMLTGTLPFGTKGSSIVRSILTDEPARIGSPLQGAPPALDLVVAKALQKDPEKRYQDVSKMVVDLERVERGEDTNVTGVDALRSLPAEARESPHTVAVLPLINLSPDPGNDYICDGLAEELINGLTQIVGLRVVSRSSSFQCKGTTLDVREIGRKLRASHLVHGSLRRSGDKLRLTAQLSEAKEGYQMWSHRFDADMKDLFSLQDELTEAILEKLRPQLGPRPASAPLQKRSPRNPEAYQLYLRSRYFFNQQTAEGHYQALDCLNRSLELDPEIAAVHVAIAECHAQLEWYGLESTAEAIPRVKAALEAGLKLEQNYVPGICLLASVQAGHDWDWARAERTFADALAAGAGFSALHFHYALDFLTPLGRLEEARSEIMRTLELDPLSAITSTALGGCYYRMRLWDEAAVSLRSTLELHPGFGHAHWSLGRVLLEQQRGEEALYHFTEAIRIAGRTPAALAELGYGFARLKRNEEARSILTELETMASRQFVSPISVAIIFAGLGDGASVMSHLERAFEQRARQLVWINVDPRFDLLRKEPAFLDLISRIGLTVNTHSGSSREVRRTTNTFSSLR
jgi:eukaryotic-like serine/threonine-protein kinase